MTTRGILVTTISVLALSMLTFTGMGCGAGGEMPTTEKAQQAIQCEQEAKMCFDACHQEAEVWAQNAAPAVKKCKNAFHECLQGNPDNPDSCTQAAQACLEAVREQQKPLREALQACVGACKDAFSGCVPSEPPDFVDDCLAEACACMEDCKATLHACLESVRKQIAPWIEAVREQVRECIKLAEQGVGVQELLACFQEIIKLQPLPDIDFECIQTSAECLQACGITLHKCIEKGP